MREPSEMHDAKSGARCGSAPFRRGSVPKAAFDVVFHGVVEIRKGQDGLGGFALQEAQRRPTAAAFGSRRLTRGTPTKMQLFSADSRISAALSRASDRARREEALSGSSRVAKRYKCPIVGGAFAVRSVHVYGREYQGGQGMYDSVEPS